MADENIPQVHDAGFEALKNLNDFGKEFWSARNLQPLLGYTQWRSFAKAVEKAITSFVRSKSERKPIWLGD
jgi:DNA-damage-inducible protein D